ncbi:MAG TPA: hypothetical protein VNW46_13740, partial [Gemmatimonadaceae bacterium]|nr:hypothetical protein [Gemmatimonadaceae bacterium]
VQVGGGAAVSQHIATAFPAGAYQLTVGSGPFVVRAVVVLRGVLDAERWERVGQWAAAVHGAESSA